MLETYAAASLLLLACIATPGLSQNIDTATPILRQVDGLPNGVYFGYTLVLHQTDESPESFAEAINGARIVVSAPKMTVPNGEPTTGAVYSCPVNTGPCTGLPGMLFDSTANFNNESKTDQFLGGSMASNGQRFMVCAHRYTFMSGSNPYPSGKCFYTLGRSLSNFEEYLPCRGSNTCTAGTGSAIDSNNRFAVGAPGRSNWGGGMYILNGPNTNGGSAAYALQGYTLITGRFRNINREDFAVSLPRRNSYFGSVNIILNQNTLRIVSQPLAGMQMGEYYGFSLLAVDLNGDGFDELLVGAPLFRANSTEPETGRVFLYRNVEGNLEFARTIEGRMRYSRFGYAMANLGDINGDGFDDVAISAPFTEEGSTNPGTVFIYHSSSTQLLTAEPQQTIRGSDLILTQDLSMLRGFGSSLASGVDVDMNGYNDLLIGSFMSQQAFLLRTRPLARVTTTVTSDFPIIDVLVTRPECELNGADFACFEVSVCVNYDGVGLMDTLTLNVTLYADTQNVEQRVLFANNQIATSVDLMATRQTQACEMFTAYIQPNLNDVFNPFVMDASIQTQPRTVTAGDGNQTPVDLSGSPVVSILGTPQVQVETLKQCGGGDCIPDLRISVTEVRLTPTDSSSPTTIIAGFTTSIDYMLTVNNPLEDAFQARLVFDVPTSVLELVNVFNLTSNGQEVSLGCNQPETLFNENNEPLDMTRHDCSIGNPFSGPGSITLRVQFTPRSGIVGNENDLAITFTVSSLNPESPATIADGSNSAISTSSIGARADISIDDGVVNPAQISYSDTARLPSGADLVNVTQLGPAVAVSFVVRNSGPSRIPTSQLNIQWPLNSTLTGSNYYLYITSIEATGGASVTCAMDYVNPDRLTEDAGGDQEGSDPIVGNGRRKRRSVAKRSLKKRQESVTPTEQELSQNITLMCAPNNPILQCVNIRCTIQGFQGGSIVQIAITSRLDERFFSTDNDRYTIIPTANVSIVSDFIMPNSAESPQDSASAQVRVIPAARVVSSGDATPVPWWAIFVPILAAVIIIAVVASLLWVFGFFRRRKHEEIKARREELQNLNDNGVTPAGAEDVANL